MVDLELERDEELATWALQARPRHTALLLIDLQNDFVHPDGWVATQRLPGFLGDSGITAALERAGALLAAAREAGVLRVFVQMLGDDRYLSPAWRAQYRRIHGRARPVCVQEGTWGADFYGELRPDERAGELVVEKHRYSAFIGTRLDLLLRSHGVRTLAICGVATSGCVESTIRDGFMLDYYVVIPGDACADYDPARHRASLAKLDLSFGTLVGVDDLRGVWQAGAKRLAPAG